ncbi:uncharacterized protein [Rhodnius prolixus]|uniref:BTB domain-containing protein n=1 Tax=Rhodnius prolixus TaxID=13249 RepID=T1I530_RHOPR
MESNNWGRNVDTERKVNDYPVALKIYDTNNFTTSSSDEDDDPYSLLRGKRFPKNEEPKLYTQEKFTLPSVSIGIEAVLNEDEKDEIHHKESGMKCLEKRKHLVKNLSNIIKFGQKSVGRPGTKFSVDTKFNFNNYSESMMECINAAPDLVKSRGGLDLNFPHNENVKNKRCDHPNSQHIENYPDKAEVFGNNDMNGTKSLVERLVTHCRALAMEQLHPRDELMTSLKKEVAPPRDNRKICSIWDWKPKKEQQKVGSKLETNHLKLPIKLPNFVKLFKQFCTANCADMKIIIDDTVFHCHKIVLQCYSKFFQTHIRGKGYKKDVLIEIPHSKVNKNVFMDIYIWMLNSPKHCKNTFANHNILNLLIAAAFLKIDELEKHCWSYISDKKNFDESTAFDLYWEARHAGYWPVMELMVSRIKYFFLTMVQTEKFTSLTENELHLFLDSNNIAVHNEVEVFFSLLLWLRKRNVPEPWECSLFKLIRFSHISPIQLVELQSMNELHYIIKHYPINEMIEKGLRTAIRREHCMRACIDFNDPEPQARNWLRKTVIYKSFNEFVDNLLKRRGNMRKPNYELMRREALEGLKLSAIQMWTPISRTTTN